MLNVCQFFSLYFLVNKSVKPRPPSCQSVPGLLSTLQSEWDSQMLETFELRKHVEMVRNQLSHTLYQHDAACRVIARLMRERDEARAELEDFRSKLSSSAGSHNIAAAAAAAAVEESSLSPGKLSSEIETQLRELESSLRSARKSRAIPETLAKPGTLSNFKVIDTFNLHSSTSPGVSCIDMLDDMLLSGGIDGSLILFDIKSQRVTAKGSSHAGPITSALFIRNGPCEGHFLSSSKDKSIKIWKKTVDEDGSIVLLPIQTLRGHQAEVSSVSIHPSGLIAVSAGLDKSMMVWDLKSFQVLKAVRDLPSACTSITFQPDGMLIAVGCSGGEILLFDTISCELQMSLGKCHEKMVSSLNFSENGFHLLSAGGNEVKLWDLRKGTCIATHVSSISSHSKSASPFEVIKAVFDRSGSYCLITGHSGVEILSVTKKSMEFCTTLEGDHSGWVTAVIDVSGDMNSIVTSSLDRTVRVWSI